MSRKFCIFLCLCCLVGCEYTAQTSEFYQLYCLQEQSETFGDPHYALDWWEKSDTTLTAEKIARELLDFAPTETYKTPFPYGTSLVGYSEDASIITLQLSWHYSELGGVARTLADYSLVRTLCQLPHVSGVILQVVGEENNTQIRRVGDLELTT